MSDPKNVRYMKAEELDNLKKKLYDKLFNDIKKKYNSLLCDKGYTAQRFIKDFQNQIDNNFDFNNPDYKQFFRRVEKIILKKLSNISDKKSEQLPDKKEVEAMGGIDDNILIKDTEIDEHYKTNFQNTEKKKRNDLRQILDKKRQDEWALIAEYEYNNYLVEDKQNKKIENEKKKSYRDSLSAQVKDKIKRDMNSMEDEILMHEAIKNTLKKLESEENAKLANEKKTTKMLTESLANHMKGMLLFH